MFRMLDRCLGCFGFRRGVERNLGELRLGGGLLLFLRRRNGGGDLGWGRRVGDRFRRDGHQRIDTRDQEHSRRHHRRGVNERAHGRRAFHRVRQPDVQRHLAGLAHRAAEEQQPNRRAQPHADPGRLRDELGERGLLHAPRPTVVEEQRARLRAEPQDAEEEKHVADARGDEGFLRRRRRARFMEPEPDEQIARETHHFPAHEEQEQVVRDDEAEHRRREEREEREEAREVVVVRHVADAEDEDERADERDHHEHRRRERVQHPAELEGSFAEHEPVEVMREPHRRVRKRLHEARAREEEREHHRPDGERGGRRARRTLHQRAQSRREQRQRGNQPEVLDERVHPFIEST